MPQMDLEPETGMTSRRTSGIHLMNWRAPWTGFGSFDYRPLRQSEAFRGVRQFGSKVPDQINR